MLNDIVKEISDTVKESVQNGLKSISDKFEGRIKALEERKLPEAIKGDKGDSVTIEEIEPILKELVDGIKIPEPINGKDAVVDYDAIQKMINDVVEDAVSKINIPNPRNGDNGRDAIDIEIEPSIDESKSYPRSTYATHEGGLWRSFEKTNGMRGWECIVDGVKDISIDYDSERLIKVKTIKSSGAEVNKEFSMPVMVYKDVWREGEYKAQDCVTLSGSLWVALEDTNDRPGDSSKAWRTVAKRGGTGKSAFDIARDAGFKGTREEWVESLGKKAVVKI